MKQGIVFFALAVLLVSGCTVPQDSGAPAGPATTPDTTGTAPGAPETGGETQCLNGFILYEGYCNPRVLDVTWDAPMDVVLSEWFKVGTAPHRTVRNFLNNAQFVADVNQVVGQETNTEQKARNIANWVKALKPYGCDLSNLEDDCKKYSPVNNGSIDLSDFDYIYNFPTGVCYDSAVITVAALRAAGIPALLNMPPGAGFHANVLAFIDDRWVEIDSTFCSQQQIDGGACPDASWSEEPGYAIPVSWYADGDSYCRYDGLCLDAPGTPTTREVVISSDSTPTASVTVPRAHQFVERPLAIERKFELYYPRKIGSREDVKDMISAGQGHEIEQACLNGVVFDDKYLYKTLGINCNIILEQPVFFADIEELGYFRMEIPADTVLLYYYSNQATDEPIAYYSKLVAEGEDIAITYNDLIKVDGAEESTFLLIKNGIKSLTEDLGIYPTDAAVG